jgi:c-di-GMP phosphodiesterase
MKRSSVLSAVPETARPTWALLARQPILDVRDAIVGHELLFRSREGAETAEVVDDTRATAQVLVATFTDLGLETVTGAVPAWVNVGRDFLLEVDPLPLPPGRVVLELLEHAEPDDVLVERLGELRRAGFQIALDDFQWRPELEALVRLATYVKLDVRALGIDRLGEQVAALEPFGPRLVAEKVETVQERDACAALGCTLFQGWYFCRPHVVSGVQIPSGSANRLRTVAGLQNADFEAVVKTILHDPGLSVRLLRYANSAAIGSRRQVSSVREAIVLLGARAVRGWALLIVLSELAPARPATLAQAVLRGRLCETLALEAGERDLDACFAIGLLSSLDALTDVSLAEALADLPLTDEVNGALLRHEGPKGRILSEVLDLEDGSSAKESRAREHLVEALMWADDTLGSLDV